MRSLFYFLPVYRQDGQSAGQVSFEKFTTRECVCVMRTLLDSRNISTGGFFFIINVALPYSSFFFDNII